MRFSLWMFICVIALNLPAYSLAKAQADKTITLSGTFTLQTIFKKIEKQTGKQIYYSNSILNDKEKATLEISNYTIDQLLQKVLVNKNVEWTIEEKFISIRKKKATISARNDRDTTLTIRGKVTDEKGLPIPGATIQVKGNQQGTTTAADGSFTMTAVRPNAYLIITNIAFLSREVPVFGKSYLGSISLKNYVGELDETIVLGYSTTTRRYSTSNVGTVKAKDIENQPVTNPLLALQGRVAGVMVEQSTGFANSGVAVRIQGQNSLRNGSDPLYVVDGVPISSRLPGSMGGILGTSGPGYPSNALGQGSGNPLSFLNPADIESIDILKDADATSIYGSRGAAGAILITTKKGKAGKTTIDINMQQGFGKVSRRLDLMNTTQYLEMRKEAFVNDGRPIPDAATSPSLSNVDLSFWDQQRYTDWQKVLIGGTATYTNITGSVSGGNENTQFIIGSGYNRQTTVFPGDLSDVKGSVHFNINNSSLNKKFRIQLNGNYMVNNNRLVGDDLTGIAMTLAPNAPKLYNSDGSPNWEPLADGANSSWFNPIAYLDQTLKIKTNNLISNALLSYAILPSLQIKSTLGHSSLQIDELQRRPLSIRLPEERQFFTRETNQRTSNVNSWIIEPQVNFKHVLLNGSFEALIGASLQITNSRFFAANASGFTSDLLMEDLGSAPVKSISSGSAAYIYNAGFLNLNYNFRNKYIINIAGRRDGSSRFGSENLFHNFGSVAGAWIFSNENFITNLFPFLSYGKLKTSYGSTGNDQIGDYQFLDLYFNVYSNLPYQNSTGLAPANLPNPYLQWEETRKLSTGIDLGFSADRILLNVVYYRNRSSNQLLSYDLPAVTGFGSVAQNFSALAQNSGWEISLNTTNVKSERFNWTSSFNLTINRNKLLNFPDLANSSYVTEYVIGQPFTIIKAYPYIGVDEQSGLYMVRDKEGKPTTTPIPSFQANTDATILINQTPRFFGGFQNSLSYKGFTLDFLFQFVKQIVRNDLFGIGTRPGSFYGINNVGNQPSWILDRWQKPGDHGAIQKYSTTSAVNSTFFNAIASEGAYTNSSYLRLKNANLSWQLPDRIKKSAHVQNARIFIQGQNLLTITKYKGLDPETKSSGTLPPLRILTFGLQVSM
jgi:TonB-dependent starch-binding outer membrane protein SusC